MAKDFIKVDNRQLRKFGDFTRLKRPSQAIAIMRGTLNDQAFSTRTYAQKRSIPSMFHNRTTWISSSILVNKATGKDPKKMFSEAGAAKRWKRNPSRDFMGMRDQEFGRPLIKPNINTLWSRGGSFSSNVKPSLRRKKLGSLQEISGTHSRIIGMLRKMQKEGYKKAFYIKGSTRIKKGIYKFSGKLKRTKRNRKLRPIVMIQDMSKPRVSIQKKPWLTTARKMGANQKTTIRFFKRNWIRYTKARNK